MRYLFQTIAAAVNIYSFMCFIRIILTWFPGAAYTGFGRFLSNLCDPFLNMFRGIRWMRIGNLDFSPAVAIGILSVLSSVFTDIANTGRLYFVAIVAVFISMLWSIIASFFGFLLILLVIRLIVMLSQRGRQDYNSFWSGVDYSLSPFVLRITKIFAGNRMISYRTALIISIVMLILILVGGQVLNNYLIRAAYRMPF